MKMKKHFVLGLLVIVSLCAGSISAQRAFQDRAGAAAGRAGTTDPAEAYAHSLHFALFADGEIPATTNADSAVGIPLPASFVSRLILINLSDTDPVKGLDRVRGAQGDPVDEVLNDESTLDGLPFEIVPGGMLILSGTGAGPLKVGSAVVHASGPISGSLVITGPTGGAAMEHSPAVASFVAPLDPGARNARPVRNAVALTNLENQRVMVNLSLRGPDGGTLAETAVILPAKGQLVKFVDQLPWVTPLDSTALKGTLRGETAFQARIALVSLAVTADAMWELPVSRAR
ncbi:MAG: hypothetical protein P8Z74_17200 [Acidobacteriota bacterium]